MPQALEPGSPTVWDGRFEIVSRQAGLALRPLAGVAARLPAAERHALKTVPASARPALPVLSNDLADVTCPILARAAQVHIRCLVGSRLASVCGLIAGEHQL